MVGDMSEQKDSSEWIKIGEWIYYPTLLKLQRRRDSKTLKLEPRVGALLSYLINNQKHPSSREALFEAVWPGQVVGDEALASAVNKLRRAFEDDSYNPNYVETISKVGYRLIADVTRQKDSIEDDTERDSGAPQHRPSPNKFKFRFGTAFLLICGIVLFFSWKWNSIIEQNQPQDTTYLTPIKRPTIAILPFENLSDDKEQVYFADGISEDIITELSRYSEFRVLARNSSFRFRGLEDHAAIIQALGVSFLIEGSVRRYNDELRISARLIDANSGENLWAERYDRRLSDVFSVQDDVTRNIVMQLTKHMTGQNLLVHERPTTNNFEAYDLYLKGRREISKRTQATDTLAMSYYRQAIEIDPDFARAYGALAVAISRWANAGYSGNQQKAEDEALFYAHKGVELGPKSQSVYWALGFTHLSRGETLLAERSVVQSLRIAPNYANGMSLLALIKNNLGKADEAIRLIEKAKTLNPQYTWDYLFNLGFSNYILQKYDTALRFLQLALERNENARVVKQMLAATFVALGRTDDAAWEIEELQTNFPGVSITFLERETSMKDVALKDRFFGHLRQAGLPD